MNGNDKQQNLVRLQIAVHRARIDLLQAIAPSEKRAQALDRSHRKLAMYRQHYPEIFEQVNPYRRAYEAGILDYQDLFAIARDDLDDRLIGHSQQRSNFLRA